MGGLRLLNRKSLAAVNGANDCSKTADCIAIAQGSTTYGSQVIGNCLAWHIKGIPGNAAISG